MKKLIQLFYWSTSVSAVFSTLTFAFEVMSLSTTQSQIEPPFLAEKYQGKLISLSFQEVPVRTVLQILAEHAGVNLVTSDTVSGTVTLQLERIPWDHALDLVLKLRGLAKSQEGEVLLIAPAEEFALRQAKLQHLEQQQRELGPLEVAFMTVHYAKASEVAVLIAKKDHGLLSPKGAVTVDDRTNTLVVKDTALHLEQIEQVLKRLDVPVKQVLIESRIVSVRDNVRDEIGVRWGFSKLGASGEAWSGSSQAAGDFAAGTLPALGDGWNVNLPVASAAGSLAYHVTNLGNGVLLDLELSALEQENKADIIASPRLITANQRKARIEQGTEIPYLEASSSGATTVSFKKAVLSLEVTPQITADNKVILVLEITQDTRGETVQTGNGPAQAIDTQRIQTQVLVENGATVVLGGIYQQQFGYSAAKVPLLGDLPVLGHLFKRENKFNEKTELLIFVTPTIEVAVR